MQEHGAAVEDNYSDSLDGGVGERLSLTVARDWLPGRRWLHAQCAMELQPLQMVKDCSRNSDGGDGCSRTEYEARGAERHGGRCDGGLKCLFVGEGICYMHRGNDMTVMIAVWLRERE
ncbi:putative prosaposin receptor GPR37L1-like [Sesbania bispinosa]|nr:putative prosaposin receptor GPR37L1-like [Sesbania bispinosa]